MKKILFAILMSLVFVSCGTSSFDGKVEECRFSEITENGNIIVGWSTPIMLYHFKTVIYKDSTLRYVDSEQEEAVYVVVGEYSSHEEKEIEDVTNIDTTFTNIVWVDYKYEDNNIVERVFYNNDSKEVVCYINDVNGDEHIHSFEYLEEYNYPTNFDEFLNKYGKYIVIL